MAEYLVKGESLTAIADAIRTKTGSSDSLYLEDMPSIISGIETGGENVGFCTINMTTDYAFEEKIYYKGETGWHIEIISNLNQIPMQLKAACNSVICVAQSGFYSASVSDGDILYFRYGEGFIYQVPNTADTTITIDIVTD